MSNVLITVGAGFVDTKRKYNNKRIFKKIKELI